MKLRLAIFSLLLLTMFSCRNKTTVVESTYPDGSPKRVCVYTGKGEKRELVKETFYYKNKKTQVTGEYKHAQRDGKWTYYYESGNVWSDGFFRDGKSDGKRLTYFPNGKLRYEAHYKNDNRVGVWKFYDESGKLVKSVDYSKSGNASVQDIPEQSQAK